MDFDVIVIGSGPGGYVCAIRAAQLGFKTACVEKYPILGGTCLNVGCIPSKSMLHSSELYHQASHSFKEHGIEISGLSLNLERMLSRKGEVVSQLTSGIAGLFKKNKITSITGLGRLLGQGRVEISGESEKTVISGRHIVLATGSKPIELPFMPFDNQTIVSSTGALAFQKVPQHLLVVGGGVIGLELGSVWQRLGAEVTVVEFMDRILPPMDGAVSREMKRLLGRQGMKFHLDTKVTAAKLNGDSVQVSAEDKTGKKLDFQADKVLVAVGRRPFTDGLGLESAGVATDSKGRIVIDDHYRTNLAGVYAIGDVVEGLMLAHKAEDEGVAVAEILAGKAGHVNYEVIPNIVYTWPEVAAIGKTEEELSASNVPFNSGQVSFKANARGRCTGESAGFIKILAHRDTDRILGVHAVGPHVSEIIQEAVVAMEFGGSAEDLARTVHGHPTYSESVKEAALAVDGRTIQV